MTVNPLQCGWCGNLHGNKICQLVKAIEFYADGATIKRVEFKTAMDYPPVISGDPRRPTLISVDAVSTKTVISSDGFKGPG